MSKTLREEPTHILLFYLHLPHGKALCAPGAVATEPIVGGPNVDATPRGAEASDIPLRGSALTVQPRGLDAERAIRVTLQKHHCGFWVGTRI